VSLLASTFDAWNKDDKKTTNALFYHPSLLFGCDCGNVHPVDVGIWL
jgi:hypothetical protein